jgi:RecB family exonuclease
MSNYNRRKSNLYQPGSNVPFRISRSKIDLFLQCPRCFYLDRRLGLGRPSWPSWPLNSAVDQLLKNEFDLLRKKGEAHELMKRYRIEAIPFKHPKLSDWRDDHYHYKGAAVLHRATNLEICGIIDDLWINPQKELIVVDYKATSTKKEISLDDEYKQGFKKQMEVYQWIFRQKDFKVSDTGYFVYANAGRNRPKFDGRLEFEVEIIAYEGDDAWVEPTIVEIKKCLESEDLPDSNPDCEYCTYRRMIGQEEA